MTNKPSQPKSQKKSKNLFIWIPAIFFTLLGSFILYAKWQSAPKNNVLVIGETYEKQIMQKYFSNVMLLNYQKNYEHFFHEDYKKRVTLDDYQSAYQNRDLYVSYAFARKRVEATPNGIAMPFYIKFKNRNPNSKNFGREHIIRVFFEIVKTKNGPKILRTFERVADQGKPNAFKDVDKIY